MDYSKHDVTAYCGLYCGDCLRLKSKASDLAAELCDELERTDFETYAKIKALTVSDMEHYEDALDVLKAIVNLHCKAPCRIGGGCSGFTCDIVTCCTDKGYEGCWECGDLESCTKSDFLAPYCGDGPKKNCGMIKRNGIDKWVPQREKFYTWQQTEH